MTTAGFTIVLERGRTRKYRVQRSGQSLSYLQVLSLWQTDSEFRTCFLSALTDAPFSAMRWETPAVSCETSSQDFQFVLFDAPELIRPADPTAFGEYFQQGQATAEFNNLGGDAFLVAPCPQGSLEAYSHLAAFSRRASTDQNHALWQRVGRLMADRLGDCPVWLNTAGMGVSWLHVRIDSRPKYYGFGPYRDWPLFE